MAGTTSGELVEAAEYTLDAAAAGGLAWQSGRRGHLWCCIMYAKLVLPLGLRRVLIDTLLDSKVVAAFRGLAVPSLLALMIGLPSTAVVASGPFPSLAWVRSMYPPSHQKH